MTAAGNGHEFQAMRPESSGLALSPARQRLFDTGWYCFAREQRDLHSLLRTP